MNVSYGDCREPCTVFNLNVLVPDPCIVLVPDPGTSLVSDHGTVLVPDPGTSLVPDHGTSLVPVADPSKAVKVERIAENNPSKITGIIPVTQHQFNRIEIRARFAGSGTIKLKAPRTITSCFLIEAA